MGPHDDDTADPMEVLTRTKAADILSALREEPMHVRRIQEEVGGSATTIQNRLDELLDAGLIQESRMEEKPKRRILTLTDSGETLTAKIDAIRPESFELIDSESKRYDLPSRATWMLALLHELGPIEGSTKLVKLLFLLPRESGVKPDQFYSFSPYKYGPFSQNILQDARNLRNRGEVEITDEVIEPADADGDVIIRKDYRLTEEGNARAERVSRKLSKEEKAAIQELSKFNRMSTGRLLNYVYSKYREESLGDEAGEG